VKLGKHNKSRRGDDNNTHSNFQLTVIQLFMYNHVTFSNVRGMCTLYYIQSNYGFKHELYICNKIIIQEDYILPFIPSPHMNRKHQEN